MDEFRLRKALNILPGIILALLMLGLGGLTLKLYMSYHSQEQRMVALEQSIAALSQHNEQDGTTLVSFPIHENMSEVYEDFSVLAMTSGRFDLARRYVQGVSAEKREELSSLLVERELQKQEIQSLILSVLSDRESMSHQEDDSGIFKGLISIEPVNETTTHDVVMTKNILMVAYLSAELGFAGWEDVRHQLKEHALVIADVAPNVATICHKISEYDAELKVAND